MKKFIVTLTLIAATTLGTVQKSHALVALASWNPPLIGASFLIWSGALVPSYAGFGLVDVARNASYKKGVAAKIASMASYGVGGLLIGTAIVMAFGGCALLPDGTAGLEYSAINAADQAKLGLSDAEAQSFNSELEQVNLIMREVTGSLNQIEKPTVEDSVKEFSRFDGLLSENTVKALQKISLTLVQQ